MEIAAIAHWYPAVGAVPDICTSSDRRSDEGRPTAVAANRSRVRKKPRRRRRPQSRQPFASHRHWGRACSTGGVTMAPSRPSTRSSQWAWPTASGRSRSRASGPCILFDGNVGRRADSLPKPRYNPKGCVSGARHSLLHEMRVCVARSAQFSPRPNRRDVRGV
jgi:hypothetical protein